MLVCWVWTCVGVSGVDMCWCVTCGHVLGVSGVDMCWCVGLRVYGDVLVC